MSPAQTTALCGIVDAVKPLGFTMAVTIVTNALVSMCLHMNVPRSALLDLVGGVHDNMVALELGARGKEGSA